MFEHFWQGNRLMSHLISALSKQGDESIQKCGEFIKYIWKTYSTEQCVSDPDDTDNSVSHRAVIQLSQLQIVQLLFDTALESKLWIFSEFESVIWFDISMWRNCLNMDK